MLIAEFNEKYKEFLSPGHSGLEIDNELVIKFLDQIFENYLTKVENFTFYQIKIKYNTVRFYSSLDVDILGAALIDLIEDKINNLLGIQLMYDTVVKHQGGRVIKCQKQ